MVHLRIVGQRELSDGRDEKVEQTAVTFHGGGRPAAADHPGDPVVGCVHHEEELGGSGLEGVGGGDREHPEAEAAVLFRLADHDGEFRDRLRAVRFPRPHRVPDDLVVAGGHPGCSGRPEQP
jgi:hypothetical protein